jgi:hypothetical protein
MLLLPFWEEPEPLQGTAPLPYFTAISGVRFRGVFGGAVGVQQAESGGSVVVSEGGAPGGGLPFMRLGDLDWLLMSSSH